MKEPTDPTCYHLYVPNTDTHEVLCGGGEEMRGTLVHTSDAAYYRISDFCWQCLSAWVFRP